MQINADTLARVAGTSSNDNMQSTVAGLARAGIGAGLNRPHRLAHFLGQLAHESQGWKYDKEIWGPTAAQRRYDTRTDLGNTAAVDGDGFRYRGRGPIQITGRSNYAAFRDWARRMDPQAPDFVSDPDAVLSDPWEGLGPIWYWETRGLNVYADADNLRGITQGINGGTNGLADRQARYVRSALVLLGHPAGSVSSFQRAAGLTADGIAGPRTLAALHKALRAAQIVSFAAAPAPATTTPTTPAQPSWLRWLNRLFGG